MTNLPAITDSVNPMTPMSDLSSRLKRDLAFSRAAQLLADADRLRDGLPRLQLSVLDPNERDFYKATSRALIEVFETMTAGKEPDAVVAQRDADHAQKEAALARQMESRLAIERSTARQLASERGHDLTAWGPHGPLPGDERASCRRCARSAYISLGVDPVLSGTALDEGCLVDAGESADPRRV